LQANNQRIRWTGGNITNTADRAFSIWGGSTSDIMFNDVNVFGAFYLYNNGAVQRFAIINSTLDGNPYNDLGLDFMFYSSPNTGSRYSDFILANCRCDTQSGNGVFRFQYTDRLLVTDCISNEANPNAPNSGFRLGRLTDNVHVENMIWTSTFYASYNPGSPEQQFSNGRFENCSSYVTVQTFQFEGNPPNSGIVSNSQMHSDTFGIGGPMGIGGLTDGGNPNVIAWDGTSASIDYSEMPGKNSVTDYGAQR
jgi:hypothetical protein